MTKEELAGMIDHTFLKAAGAPDAVRKLCREAKTYHFAGVTVNPAEVKLAARLLKGSGVRVGTVVGFPLGANMIETKLLESLAALEHGAVDLDVVVNIRMLKAAVKNARVRAELAANMMTYVEVCRDKYAKASRKAPLKIVTKLILECCYLTDEEKVLGCKLAKDAGFDFVKTSTGFGEGGATVHDVKLMRKAVGRKMGVKAAGGIRTLEDAKALIAAGANRLGCSASVDIVKALK